MPHGEPPSFRKAYRNREIAELFRKLRLDRPDFTAHRVARLLAEAGKQIAAKRARPSGPFFDGVGLKELEQLSTRIRATLDLTDSLAHHFVRPLANIETSS